MSTISKHEPANHNGCPTKANLSAAKLATILDGLDVPFLQSYESPAEIGSVDPILLLSSLAANNEARMRAALIPLLLRHPEFSRHAQTAVQSMPKRAQLSFTCFYSAASILQRKYSEHLNDLLPSLEPLPDLFLEELGVSDTIDSDQALQMLAERHRVLSGLTINRLGTYEHAS